MNRRFWITASACALLSLTVTSAPVAAAEKNTAETYRLLNLFGDVFERVRAEYVEDVSDEELIEAALNGMLTSLDPHSSYLTAKNFRDMQVQTKGEFGGLGIEVTMENGWVKVVSPIDDTPAFRAGLQPGDFVTHLDGEPVTGLSLSEAVDRMRGPVNTDIRLTIRRTDVEPFDVRVTRDTIRIQAVKAKLEDTIGYVRVTAFNERTDSGLKNGMDELDRQAAAAGKKIEGYVIDLRNNPGGLLDQAVAVSDAFLDRGEIVSTRSRDPEETQRFNAHNGDLAKGLPIVVLINDGSASASEIVAGALQDHRRAIVLGTKSFGKGSVQTVIPLPGHGAMRLTTARYYTPSGRSIQAVGIEPDIKVQPAKIETVARNGERRSESSLRNALGNENAPPEKATPTEEPAEDKNAPAPNNGPKPIPGPGAQAPSTTPASEPGDKAPAVQITIGDPSSDYQMARALDLLRGLSLYKGQMAN